MSRLLLSLIAVCAFAQKPDYVYGIRNKPFVDVREYGAKGDGLTVDTSALQSAINAAAAVGGDVVYFPPGTYKTGPLTLPTYVTLRGAGRGSSVLLQATANASLVTSTSTWGVAIRDMQLRDTVSTVAGALIDFNVANDTAVSNVFLDGGFYGWHIQGSYKSAASDVQYDHSVAIGILADGAESSLFDWRNVWGISSAIPVNISLKSAGGIYWDNVGTFGGGIGLSVGPGAGQHVGDLFLVNCSFDSHTDQGINITPTTVDAYVTRFQCSNCWSATNKQGLWVDATNGKVRGLSWVGGRVINNREGGVALIGDVKDVLLEGLDIGYNSTALNGTYVGIAVTPSASDVRIFNNRIGQPMDYFGGTEFTNQQSAGISLYDGASDYLKISGNVLRGDVFTLYNGSTGTHNEITNNAGYNPIGSSSVTVTASPFTYTAGSAPETVYIQGGTVSAVARGASTICSASPCYVALPPNGSVVVTYTVAPTVVKDIQ